MATVVTAKGREIVVGRMQGTTPTQGEPLNVGWGLNPATLTAAVTDVAPFKMAPEAFVAGTSSTVTTTTTNDTYQVVATITAAGGQTVAEVFMSDSATKPYTTTVSAASGVIGSSTSTSLSVTSSFTPANNTTVQIRTEVLKVTAGTGTQNLTVTRAQNGSTAITTIASADQVTAGNIPSVSTANQNFFLHGDFTGIALNTNDSIAFTIQVKFS